MSRGKQPLDRMRGERDQSSDQPIRPPVRVGYTISHEANRKVKAAKLATGRSENELVNEALLRTYAGYYVGYRGPNGAAEAVEPEPAA